MVSTYRCRRACVSGCFTLFRATELSTIPLPFDGQFDLVDGDARIDGVLLRDRRWTTRSRYWSVRSGVVSEVAIVPVPPDGIELNAEEVTVSSAEGTRVPLSIVYPRR